MLNNDFTVVNQIFWNTEFNFTSLTQACVLPVNLGESLYPHIEENKVWNNGEPSQEWPANQNYPKSAVTPHPRGHKRTHNNI